MPLSSPRGTPAGSSRPLRVLMVSDVYFPRINGVSTSIKTFRHALAGQGVEVRLVVPRYGDEAASEGIVRVPGRRVPRDPEDRIVGWRAMHRAALAAAADCDAVHIQTPFVAHWAGLAAARQHGLPALTTYHTFFEEYLHHYAPFLPSGWLRSLARSLSRRQCNAVDSVIVPSTAMRERLAAYGVHTPMQVLPTGIPLQDFGHGDGARFRRQHGIAPTAVVALYVGRVAHEKNIPFLIEVARHLVRQLPHFVLLIAGEGPALPALRQAAAEPELAGCVRFAGYLERSAALPDCYAAADVFTFASRTETQGLVLLEAMAAGLPVAALSAMGTADILGPTRGSIAPPDEPVAFAQALLPLLRDAALRKRLADAAAEHVLEWSDAQMAQRLAGHYRSLIA